MTEPKAKTPRKTKQAAPLGKGEDMFGGATKGRGRKKADDAIADPEQEFAPIPPKQYAKSVLAKVGKIGLHEGIPEELYHRSEGISKSGLVDIRESPEHYRFAQQNPRPSSGAQGLGRAFHCLLLEPEKFESEFVKSEYPEFRTNEAKAWRTDQEALGKTVVGAGRSDIWKPSEWDLIHRMRDAVMKNSFARRLIEKGQAELTGYFKDPEFDVLGRFRLDWLSTAYNFILDVKSSTQIDPILFGAQAAEYFYDMQDVYYRRGMAALGKPVEEFAFLVINKTPPYGARILVLKPKGKERGEYLCRKALGVYSECMRTNTWPGYPQEPEDFDLPARAYSVMPDGQDQKQQFEESELDV